MNIKKFTGIVLSLFFITNFIFSQTVEVDNSSTYVPTTIVNGNFNSRPSGQTNGPNCGWNTTENGGKFEYSDSYSTYNTNLDYTKGFFIEMNADNASIFSQDLITYPGDVIRWTLDHAVRNCGDDYQTIRLLVGAPKKNGSSTLYPSGINNYKNANIVESSQAIFNYNEVTGCNGYGNTNELQYLRLSMTEQDTQWYTAKGVYIIPEGQTVTRFAFDSIYFDYSNRGMGNLLDEITFNTLIGNLSALQKGDGSIVIKGYWGETDTNKKLIVKMGETPIQINMSSVQNKNFKITIPASMVGTAETCDIYHVDYEAAKVSLSLTGYVVLNVNKDLMYQSLSAANADASYNDVLKFLDNFTEANVTLTKAMTIDGNGKKLTGNIAMANNQNLTLKGGFEITGKITLGSNTIYNSSVLNIQDKVILPEIVCSYSNRIELVGNLDSSSKITVNFDATTLSENTLIIQNWKEYCGNAKLNMIKSKKTQFKPLLKEGDIYLIENNHRNTWGQAIF